MRGTIDGLRTLIHAGAIGSLGDGELLDRFVATGEPAAFEAIVRRHAPMVWGVCRRALRDHHDAEDAFQATFLVLARRAEAVRPRDRLVAWLYGVARRTALKARATRARRRLREGRGEAPEPAATPADPHDVLAESLDRELARLPEKYRLPIVLCDLEGCTHREAADRLGCPIGTLSGRHSRARALLADRLQRRGVALTGGAWFAFASEEASAAPIARALDCAGRTATLPSTVAALAREVQGGLLMSKIKTSVAALLMVAAAGMGVVGFAQDRPVEPPTVAAPVPRPRPENHEGSLTTHAYYVGDLIGAKAEILANRELTYDDMRPIIDLVTSRIAPGTWREGDDPGPSITPFFLSISLIIRHDRATHERISVLLGHLRRVHDSRLDKYPTPPVLLAPPGPDGRPAREVEVPRAGEVRPGPVLVNHIYTIGDLLGVVPGPPKDPDAMPEGAWHLVGQIIEKASRRVGSRTAETARSSPTTPASSSPRQRIVPTPPIQANGRSPSPCGRPPRSRSS